MVILPVILMWLMVFLILSIILILNIFGNFFQPQGNSARCKLITVVPIYVKMEEHVFIMKIILNALALQVSNWKFIVFSKQKKKKTKEMSSRYLSVRNSNLNITIYLNEYNEHFWRIPLFHFVWKIKLLNYSSRGVLTANTLNRHNVNILNELWLNIVFVAQVLKVKDVKWILTPVYSTT